jgi:anti-anti-sigma factor
MDLKRNPPHTDTHAQTLRIQAEPPDDQARARLLVSGEIDRDTGEQLAEAVDTLLDDHDPDTIEVDAAAVTFLDSSGIRHLLDFRAAADRRDCRLVLTRPAPVVFQVLEMTGLLEHFGLGPRATSPAPGPLRPAGSTTKDGLIAQLAAIRQAGRQRGPAPAP